MKTILYAASALIIATTAANAASTVSDLAGGGVAPTAQGERIPYRDRAHVPAPVSLQREMSFEASPPSPANTGAVFRSWTGNDNEG
ncbi:hypothetical protein [Hansschlegelia zhihuaiae]|uniref:DUF680 domain-containing protein n=1 Tax=Hansschlegelia zhihuaiae TaxID=405005 RepID=A0A4Q0MBV1_9HYPH|nr:hypothetical protein [Hansschlegelia zhihuaiae]RXF70791.1 hypothetical protein EK403_16550 [Hansschlegelia zhihuaiae]